MDSDATAISGDTVAADNLEKEYDGTGYGEVLVRTTIATLASQTSFTLTAGSADNNAYNGCIIVIEDASTAAQKAVGVVSGYTGATKTITLLNDPAVFTMAATDVVTIIADRAVKPTVDNRTLDVSAGGEAGVDWANVGSPTTVVGLSGTTVKTATDVETDTADIQSRIGTPSDLGGGASVAANLADIEAQTDDIGTAGAGLTAIPWNASWDAEVESEANDALVALKLDHLVAVADADDVVDNSIIAKLASKGATADWSTYVNTTDALEALRDRGDAAWITATSVTVSDKTGFKLASDGLDLVTAWTVAITGNITGNLSGSVGSVTGAVGSVTGAVGSVTGNVGGNVTGSVGSLATQAKADVNAEVVDVLSVDTFAEPTGAPAATAALSAKLGYLYMTLRNKITVTASAKTFFDDAGNSEWSKALSDDGTTYQEAEGA